MDRPGENDALLSFLEPSISRQMNTSLRQGSYREYMSRFLIKSYPKPEEAIALLRINPRAPMLYWYKIETSFRGQVSSNTFHATVGYLKKDRYEMIITIHEDPSLGEVAHISPRWHYSKRSF